MSRRIEEKRGGNAESRDGGASWGLHEEVSWVVGRGGQEDQSSSSA